MDGEALTIHDEARSALRDADQEHRQLIEQIKGWTAERDALTVNQSVLADAELIERLRTQAEARLGDRDRAEARRAEADNHSSQASTQLEVLLGHRDPRTVDTILDDLALPADLTAQLEALAERHSSLAADRQRDADRVEQDRADLDALVQGPSLPDVETLTPLTAAVGALTADTSPGAQLRAARDARIEARRRRCQAMIEAGAADPEATPCPPGGEEDTVAAAQRLDAARGEADRAQERLAEAETTLAERRLLQQAMEDPRTVHRDLLIQARTERDGLWADVVQAWIDRVVPVEVDPRVLATTFSDRVRAADDLADQLIGQAQADAELAQAQRNVDDAVRTVEERGIAHQAAESLRDVEAVAWAARWAEVGVAVPSTTRAEVVRQALLAAATAAVDESAAREKAQTLEPEVVEWTIRLHHLLVTLSPAAVDQACPREDVIDCLAALEERLAAAQTLMADVDRAREQQERRRTARQTLDRSQTRLTRGEQVLTDWAAQWATLLTVAALPPTLDPTGWAERRTRLDASRAAHQAAVQYRHEADAARQAWESFRSAAEELGTRQGVTGTPEEIVENVWHQLSASRAEERTYQERGTAIDDATHRLAQLTEVVATARSQLDELGHGLGLPALDELERLMSQRLMSWRLMSWRSRRTAVTGWLTSGKPRPICWKGFAPPPILGTILRTFWPRWLTPIERTCRSARSRPSTTSTKRSELARNSPRSWGRPERCSPTSSSGRMPPA